MHTSHSVRKDIFIALTVINHDGNRNSLLLLKTEKKLHQNYTKFFRGTGKEYRKKL